MPRTKRNAPDLSRQKGQRSLDPLFFDRVLPTLRQPEYMLGNAWRAAVEQQPIAVTCRDTLIANVVNLDWQLEPRDSTQRDELKGDIEYYTDLLEYSGELDYTGLIEWLGADYLDLPMGGVCEIGRSGDSREGKVMWLLPLDGATCFPTNNFDFPIGQTANGIDTVYFPDHAVNRIYMTPQRAMLRQGWGCPPPEKIYLALQMLTRGDLYYANLLLDTPQVGILDLGDMSRESATAWVNAWKSLLGGVDPFKIPVLYEHTKSAEFIPFTRPPAEIMFDKAANKYVTICTAGYGMSPSDIGFPSVSGGGETLAGTIRQERRTRKTGYALFKKKLTHFFNRVLPSTLRFKFIDMDDELNVAIGRARLATSTAIEILLRNHVIVPNEARSQMIADGLFSISMPETVDGGDEILEQEPAFGGSGGKIGNANQLGRPTAPSQGGFGEVRSALDVQQILNDNQEN